MLTTNGGTSIVIDYSHTVNSLTLLYAYVRVGIDEFVNLVIEYKCFSTIELKSTFCQAPIFNEDKLHIVFETSLHLRQFIPFPS